uniref:Gag-pol polyprotein n=1 Tax=Solanum tuberosum TaxID=4113 RepID=M1DD18_SOLTU
MVADPRAQMNKFLYGVLDLVKIECRNAMLLEDMNISRLMTHAQQVEGDKLREHAKDNKRARTGNCDYSQQKLGGGNYLSSSRNLQLQHLHQLVLHPPGFNRIRKVGHQALILRRVFQVIGPTQLVLSVVRTIQANVLQGRNDVLDVVSVAIG